MCAVQCRERALVNRRDIELEFAAVYAPAELFEPDRYLLERQFARDVVLDPIQHRLVLCR